MTQGEKNLCLSWLITWIDCTMHTQTNETDNDVLCLDERDKSYIFVWKHRESSFWTSCAWFILFDVKPKRLGLFVAKKFQTTCFQVASVKKKFSAALGFLCHSIVMISKYLAIALRYRIVCNSSRSAVQQDATTVFAIVSSSHGGKGWTGSSNDVSGKRRGMYSQDERHWLLGGFAHFAQSEANLRLHCRREMTLDSCCY